ncbi:sal-like protein 1 isoform X2 [Lineus longissimus]|uniref:sal-like protein 1 isoform X2 n=1 Tax=Lineus longissimus TaxID=88925 RepID=UPI00315D8867
MIYRGMPESQEENRCLQLDDMQQELHSKGNVLTRAWSELFSYLTKYQAELMVKEHAVEIAEKEVDIRKRQLEEMRPVEEMGSEEVTQLRNEIQAKERLLNRAQLELSASEQTVKQISSDLSNHVQMVENSRSELSETQKELVRFRNDCERLKSELALTNEQVQVKDKLLNKLQNQLMKENAELKEQLDFSLRALELEKRAHEVTKKSLREKDKSDHTLSSATSRSTMEIPDFTPSLDLSVVRDDFGLSNIIPQHGSNKTPNSPSTGPNLDSFISHPSNQCTVFPAWTPLGSPLKSPPISSPLSKPSISATNTAISSPNTSYNSTETFFPLTTGMSHERNSKTAIVDMSTYGEMQLNTNLKSPTSVSGSVVPVLNVPSLGSMDITSVASSSGAYSDGKYPKPNIKVEDSDRKVITCGICGKVLFTPSGFKLHLLSHTGERPHQCTVCGRKFLQRSTLKTHVKGVHSSYRPYSCNICGTHCLTKQNFESHLNTTTHRRKKLMQLKREHPELN